MLTKVKDNAERVHQNYASLGDEGGAPVTASYAAVITLVITLVIIAVAIYVSHKRFAAEAGTAASAKVYRARAVYFVLLAAAVVVSLAFTLPMTPYPSRFGDRKPEVTVRAVGEMWSWSLSTDLRDAAVQNPVLPAGKLVEFDVSSKDVNHNFAIYNAGGELVAQVQAMPDYTNRLFFTFAEPGHYYILCLEYCGVGHHAMNAEFDVK